MTLLTPKRKRLLILSVALAALGYLLLSLWAGWRGVWEAIQQAGLSILGLALLLSLVNYGLRFLRWRAYLKRLGHTLPWRDDLRIYLAGFALTTTPGKAGEMLRSVLLDRFHVPASHSIAAFLVERFSDLITVVLLTALGASFYPPALPWVIGTLAASLLILLLLLIPNVLERFIHFVAHRFQSLLRRLVRLIQAARRCLTPGPLLLGIGLGILAWGAEAVAFHTLLIAIEHPLPLPVSVFIYAFAMLVGGLSFLPGGLGGAEAVMTGLLVWQGLPQTEAVAATVLIRLATLWFAVAIGLFIVIPNAHAIEHQ